MKQFPGTVHKKVFNLKSIYEMTRVNDAVATFNFKLLPVVSHHVPTDMAKHQQLDSDPLPNR